MAAMQPDRIRRWLALPARLAAAISGRARQAKGRAALLAIFIGGLGLGFAAMRLAPTLLQALPFGSLGVSLGPSASPAHPASAALRDEPAAGRPARTPQTAPAARRLPGQAPGQAPTEALGRVPGQPRSAEGASPAPGLSAVPSTPLPGSFLWPADGLIVATTGWRRHPQRGDWSYQPGLELAVPSRAPVRAAADGTVMEVAMEPEGYTVSLDHGDGWVTRYSRLAAVSVRVGASVRRGAMVGYGPSVPESAVPAMAEGASPATASVPSWPGPGSASAIVGFEVRHNGEAVDPLRVMEPGWFRVGGDGGNPSGDGDANPALTGPGPGGEAGSNRLPVPGP